MSKNAILITALLFLFTGLRGQILTSIPVFPTADDEIVITYDANLGNGDLAGVIPIYAHTGVITSLSETPWDWRHVVGNWGTSDPEVVMQPLGGNRHQLTIQPSIFYDLEEGETIQRLSFVFRNANGTLVGRELNGDDIYFPIYDGSFASAFFLPELPSQLIELGSSLDFLVQSSETAEIKLTINGNEVASEEASTVLEFTAEADEYGEYEVIYTADNGFEIQSDTLLYIVQPPVTIQNPPLGIKDGINYLNASTVILQLLAPNKDFVYAVGDFNDWELRLDYQMKRTLDGNRYWLMISGLTPGQEYRFQYHIDQFGMRVADVYADKILDYWNDPYIPEESYPDLIEYPVGLTLDAVSVLQTNQLAYEWSDQSYERPEKTDLIVYELLLRDFLETPNYQTLLDTLDYLDNLGINAIQFMPINEFEGNLSWGYNPSFFFAPDKYYGPKNALKDFVDECHSRGIAVVMDIALNHSFGQNPQVRMYFDASIPPYGEPTAENPFFNQQARHDFNVGYDYNHESPYTRAFMKRVLEYWVQEFHIDGYRLDLSKGFTQNSTVGNIAAWGAYDQSRINILTDYANHLFNIDPDVYVILEHFADNSEETVLSNNGMMPWGNIHGQFTEAALGYASDLSWTSYQNRGWSDPHLVSYAESHDEERLMYSCLNFGNSANGYNITNLSTALARKELAHTFLMAVPGPKMLYQFGELGYDYSLNYCSDGTINTNCRTDAKPVRWDYLEMENRMHVYLVYKALHELKTGYPTFTTTDYSIDLGGFGKRVHLNHPDMNAVVIGNFNVTGINMVPGFQHTGTWYEYFTGDAIEESNLNNAFYLEPGEYRIYTDEPLPTPNLSTDIDEIMAFYGEQILAFPNPFKQGVDVIVSNPEGSQIDYFISDLNGRKVFNSTIPAGEVGTAKVTWNGMNLQGVEAPAGMYIVNLQTSAALYQTKIIKE